jgi:hypothetical protein
MTGGGIPYDAAAARPWLSADARRWAAARPPRWARPAWSATLLVVAVVVAVANTPDPVCTVQAPCGEEWFDAVGTMLLVPHLLSMAVLPELAVVTAPLLVLYAAAPAEWQGGIVVRTAEAVSIAALSWSWLAVLARLRARRRRRILFAEAAGGITACAPAPGEWYARPGLGRCIAGVLMCGAAAGLVTAVVVQDRADDRTARTAAAREVPVLSYNTDDYVLTVRMPDGSRHRFGVNGVYDKGDTVRVLVRGDWVRLAGEPYRDHFVFQAVGLGLAGPGVASVVSGLLIRHRAGALRRGPVPVLRARARTGPGFTEVFADDDLAGLQPLLLTSSAPCDAAAELRPVALYGPVGGGGLVLGAATGAGTLITEASLSPARRGAADPYGVPRKTGTPWSGTSAATRDARHDAAAEVRVRRALTTMTPAADPVVWQAGPAARCLGALMLVAGGGALAAVTMSRPTVWWQLVFIWGGVLIGLDLVRSLTTWRITADAGGLRVRSLWSDRHLPWESATGAHYDRQGLLFISHGPDGTGSVRVGVLGWPLAERFLGIPSRAATAATEITAMIREPELRPALRA